jgi:hypothetical protein
MWRHVVWYTGTSIWEEPSGYPGDPNSDDRECGHEFSSVYADTCNDLYKKGKAIPVTSRGGPQGCDTSRLPHFLGTRLTDGGEVVNAPAALYSPEDS